MDILLALIAQAGTVVEHDRLRRLVWPDMVVDDGNLRVQITKLRKALGVDGARTIISIPGRGYCFVGEVGRGPGQTLPRPPRHMVGRDELIGQIGCELREQRLITLVGAGGVGKTAIAAAIGRAMPPPVGFVSLGGLDWALAVERAAERCALLILDGCEHALDAAAAMVEDLLGRWPDLRILTTSRERLRVEGEQIFRLDPLAVPEGNDEMSAEQALSYPAVRLFVDQIAAGRHGFALRDEEAPIVAEICRRLDGIPLAIEIAAGQVQAYGIRQTSEMLGGHLHWRGKRTAVARHQTLCAAIGWSYDRLDDAERALLHRLSAFTGSFDLDTAGIDHAEAAALFLGLIEKSLVEVEDSSDSTRYHLLETTKSFLDHQPVEID